MARSNPEPPDGGDHPSKSRRARRAASGGKGLVGAWDEARWSGFLTERFGVLVEVSFGRSRTAPVQARALRAAGSKDGWELRLHHLFGDAPEDVREALATWLRVGRRARKAGPILDEWIHEHIASLPVPERKVKLAPKGNVHDLERMAEALFEGEFAGDFEDGAAGKDVRTRPRITWGRRTRSRSRRSLRLGSFEPQGGLIRIHPVLDQEGVPEWFVRFVLKHEILHAVIDAYRDNAGRWVHHGPAFRKREASWHEYRPAIQWEQRNLARLIRSAREGTALRVRAEDVAPLPGETSPAGKPPGEPQPVRGARASNPAAPTAHRGHQRTEGDSPRNGPGFGQGILPF